MSKVFTVFEKASIKNSAKAVASYQEKNQKLDEHIAKLLAEKEENNAYIEQYTQPIVALTGYQPLDLCEKVNRGDQNVWTFKYPKTIVPVEEEEVVETTESQEVVVEEPVEEAQEQEESQSENNDPLEDIF